jgi:hypothetical protein
MKEEQKTQNHRPLVISLGLIGLLVGCYLVWPGFREGVKEAYEVLTSDDQDRIREWVSQFGF